MRWTNPHFTPRWVGWDIPLIGALDVRNNDIAFYNYSSCWPALDLLPNLCHLAPQFHSPCPSPVLHLFLPDTFILILYFLVPYTVVISVLLLQVQGWSISKQNNNIHLAHYLVKGRKEGRKEGMVSL